MNKARELKQLCEKYANVPTSQSEYELEGKRYTVTSHYCGSKKIDEVLQRIAVVRAYRDMGLNA